MKILLLGISIVSISFLIHLIVWKIRLPKRQTGSLLIIFFGILTVSLLCLRYAANFMEARYVPVNLSEYMQIIFFCASLSLAYVITYSALEADSPSLTMMRVIADAGPSGLEKERFNELMTDDILVKPRIRDLVRDGMVYLDAGRYKITPKGASFIKVFIFYRKLLNAPIKGG